MGTKADTDGDGELRLHCVNGHRWREVLPLPMTLQAFGKRCQALSECPQCGAVALLGWGGQADVDRAQAGDGKSGR